MDRQSSAVATLEAMGWSFDGLVWNPPKSRWGPNALQVMDCMADFLQNQLDHASQRAEDNAYYRSVVDQLGPVLTAWEEVKPTGMEFPHKG